MNKNYLSIAILILFQIHCFSQNNGLIPFNSENKFPGDICLTRAGHVVGIAEGTAVRIYFIDSLKLLREFRNSNAINLKVIDISEDSTLLVAGGNDSIITVWDFLTGEILKQFIQNQPITALKISPDRKYLVSGCVDARVTVYDLKTYRIVHEFKDHSHDITSIEFSGNGGFFATSGADKRINLYRTNDLNLVTSWKAHKAWVRDLSFNYSGNTLMSCGDDARVVKWQINGDNIVKNKYGRVGYGWIMGIDLSEDQKTFVHCTTKGNIVIRGEAGYYKTTLKVPVIKAILVPSPDDNIQVLATTYGRGVFLLPAKTMKFKLL